MKEVIIKYKDSRILELLKSLAAHFDFSISERQEEGSAAKPAKDSKATDFVNKWAGFLKNSDTGSARYDYLAEKYK
ncbi:MAG: hypothetical protein KF845_02145 [Cyclobacteriaceae bacterium]|nr:hypothetical protein [Cyclobacteriaceae bacterium]